jgi:ASC-1-like (ASCH) protein
MKTQKTHTLKILPEYYRAVMDGRKTFEVRKNDRDFRVGDTLSLEQYDPELDRTFGVPLHLKVTYVLKGGQFGIEEGYCVMGVALF